MKKQVVILLLPIVIIGLACNYPFINQNNAIETGIKISEQKLNESAIALDSLETSFRTDSIPLFFKRL